MAQLKLVYVGNPGKSYLTVSVSRFSCSPFSLILYPTVNLSEYLQVFLSIGAKRAWCMNFPPHLPLRLKRLRARYARPTECCPYFHFILSFTRDSARTAIGVRRTHSNHIFVCFHRLPRPKNKTHTNQQPRPPQITSFLCFLILPSSDTNHTREVASWN